MLQLPNKDYKVSRHKIALCLLQTGLKQMRKQEVSAKMGEVELEIQLKKKKLNGWAQQQNGEDRGKHSLLT